MLYKKELHDIVYVVHKAVDGCLMWIRIKSGDLRELYIAISTFHMPTQGLQLSENHHIYNYIMIS